MVKAVAKKKTAPRRRLKKPGVLMYADTKRSADALYFGRVSVPDPFIAFSDGGRRCAVVSALEFNRVRTTSVFDEVLPLEPLLEALEKRKDRSPSQRVAAIIQNLAVERGLPGFRIGADFPAGLALALKDAGAALEVVEGMLMDRREFKSDDEAAEIKAANRAAASGMAAVVRALRAAEIRQNKRLYLDGRPLTSERLHELIARACLEHGAEAGDPIVAGGDQACDPHHRGSGTLRAHELIIVDIFPRLNRSGYHGDMTRTFLKGKASEAQRKLVATVRAAQEKALAGHRAGASGVALYRAVQADFIEAGYETKTENGVSRGFFHGLGHGLGLEVHEPPRVNARGTRLKKGQVITVEPGLYYPGLGGCRIEDVVRVGADGPELLSEFPYRWEIR